MLSRSGAACLLALALALGPRAGAQVPVIRPVEGLGMAGVTHDPRVGDIERHYTIGNVTAATYTLFVNSEIGDSTDPSKPPRRGSDQRMIRFVDDSVGHRVNFIFGTGDPTYFPGSTIFLSKAMLEELKAVGKTSAIIADLPAGSSPLGFLSSAGARQYYRGDLTRAGRTTVSVIVNNEPVSLPAIETRGHLTVGGSTDDVDIVTFDNAAWPLTLRDSSNSGIWQLTEITLPPNGEPPPVAASLAKTCRAEVHGIYFAFASAALMPESDPTLRGIAKLLSDNPSWLVTIEGHTDSIGRRAANLTLSKLRAAAVRAALVSRFSVSGSRLTATGFGDTRPVTSNATIEGRARNRRVELSRKC
jgi:outer membrane protein OmpA-like peptidoglycan-associated protein